MTDDFKTTLTRDGLLFVQNAGEEVLHADLSSPGCPEIHLASHAGNNQVVLEKMYGPTVGIPIRITVDTARNAWVIERQQPDMGWGEVAAIPLQIDSDFDDE